MEIRSRRTAVRSAWLLVMLCFSVLQASSAHAALELELDSPLESAVSMDAGDSASQTRVQSDDSDGFDMQSVKAASPTTLPLGALGNGGPILDRHPGIRLGWQRERLDELHEPEPIDGVPKQLELSLYA